MAPTANRPRVFVRLSFPTLRRKPWRRTLRRCPGHGRPEMRAFGLRLVLLAAFAAPLAVEAETLKVVEVNAPAVNCVFRANCRITVTDSVGHIPLPSLQRRGPPRRPPAASPREPAPPPAARTARPSPPPPPQPPPP